MAFDDLKTALCAAPVLQIYDPSARVTEVHTDASSKGLGGVMLQQGDDGHLHPVYYVSKKTSSAEQQYHSSKLELMAIVWTIERLRNFLIVLKFDVVTDCQALVYLNANKTRDRQVSQWCNLLQEYDFRIRYRPESKMAHVDALSRSPVGEPDDTIENLYGRYDVLSLISEEEHITMVQRSDPLLNAKINILKKPESELNAEEKNEVRGYTLQNGRLMKECVVNGESRLLYVIPKSVRKSILVRFHNLLGHFGVDRTVARIMEKYWFPRLRNYTKNHIRSCAECLISKIPGGKTPGFLHPIPLPSRPFERVHMDHLGPFLTTSAGNVYVLAFVDALTKYIRLFAVPNTSADPVIQHVREFIMDYGLPKKFVTDRGTCFTSEKFEELCGDLGISHTKISSQRPQANGQIERVNRVLITMMMATSEEDKWDEKLKEVERNCNTATNKTTGKSPFQLLFGFCPSFYDGSLVQVARSDPDWVPPQALQEEIRSRVEAAQRKSKLRYDRSRYEGTKYHVGDVVMVKRLKTATGESTKLQRRYKGPMVITEVLPHDIYRISTLDDSTRCYSTTVHVSQLKICCNPDDEEEDSECSHSEEETELEFPQNTAESVESVPTPEGSDEPVDLPRDAIRPDVVIEPKGTRSGRITKKPPKFDDYEMY